MISNELHRLLANYRRASQVWKIACRAADIPSPAPEPKVQYGYMRRGEEKDPLYAHSLAQLDDLEKERLDIATMWTPEVRDKQQSGTRIYFAELRKNFVLQSEQQRQVEQDSGYTEVQAKAEQAMEAEQAATDALFRYSPRSLAEVRAIAQIFAARIKDGCASEAEIKRFIRALIRIDLAAGISRVAA